MNEPAKVCTKCGVEYPATKEFFSARKGGNYRLVSICKKCICLKSAKWRAENPERFKASQKKWRAENSEKRKASQKKSYAKNSEKVRERTKKYRAENSEKIKAYKKKYNAENSEKINASQKKYNAENPEKIRYIQTKRVLKNQIGATPPPELVEIKVLINKTKKLCKTLNS